VLLVRAIIHHRLPYKTTTPAPVPRLRLSRHPPGHPGIGPQHLPQPRAQRRRRGGHAAGAAEEGHGADASLLTLRKAARNRGKHHQNTGIMGILMEYRSSTQRIHGAAIYGNMDPTNIPQMLAYIPAPWILWAMN